MLIGALRVTLSFGSAAGSRRNGAPVSRVGGVARAQRVRVGDEPRSCDAKGRL